MSLAADMLLRCCLVIECFLSIHILVKRTVAMHDRHAEIVAANGTEMVAKYNLLIISSVCSCWYAVLT